MAKLVICRSQVPVLVSETSREDAGLGQCGWNPQGMNSGLASLCFYSGWPFKSVLHGDNCLWGPPICPQRRIHVQWGLAWKPPGSLSPPWLQCFHLEPESLLVPRTPGWNRGNKVWGTEGEMILGLPSQKLTHPASPGDMPQSSPALFADCRDLGCPFVQWP